MIPPAELAKQYRRTANTYDSYAANYRLSDSERAEWADSAAEMRRRADDVEASN